MKRTMHRNLLRWILEIFFLTIFSTGALKAQFAQLREDIYLKDESSMSVGLQDISEHKIKFKNELNKVRTIDASEVLMVFNKVSEYIIYPCKDLTSFKAENFLKSTGLPPSDLLVNLDKSLIPAKIISKNENDIVYENTEEPSGEQFISKDLVAAILYKSGNHELLVSPSEAAKVLAAEATAIANFRLGMSIKSQTLAKETTKPSEAKELTASSSTEQTSAPKKVISSPVQDHETVTSSTKEIQTTTETKKAPSVQERETVTASSKEVTNNTDTKKAISSPVPDRETVTATKEISQSATPKKVISPPVQDRETVTSSTKEVGKNSQTPTQPTVKNVASSNQGTNSIATNTEGKGTASVTKNDTAGYPSNLNIELFSKKALEKTKELSVYLNIISDKGSDFQQANKAIDQACALFVSEEARVEISTNKGQDYKVRFKIREYLNRLKLLKYDKVDISWTNINYVSNFRKGPDGNYYGMITLQQRFNGLMEGRVVYSDITRKNVEVVLKSYNKEVEGKTQELWDVLLSDIGLVVAKTE